MLYVYEEDSLGLHLVHWEEVNGESCSHKAGKHLVCLGAVEEILLTSWNEGKEVVFQWKDVCPIPASASC